MPQLPMPWGAAGLEGCGNVWRKTGERLHRLDLPPMKPGLEIGSGNSSRLSAFAFGL